MLTEGSTLLERIPHPRPPQAVVGLLRLRPTDVDWLHPLVHDTTLRHELTLVTRRWRQQ